MNATRFLSRTRTRPHAAAAALLAAALGWAGPAHAAGDDPKDDALDQILQQIDDKPAEAKPAPKADEAKPARKDEKPVGELAPKDEAIDSLLEKLGETKEEPSPNGKPMPKADEPPMPGDPPRPDEVEARDKSIDEDLEEKTGRKKKKKGDQQQGENSGPLAETIKQMREVEKRLGEPDTGEETRKKQAEIVKQLDNVLEQLRTVEMKPGKGKPQKPGDQPGKQPGSKPGEGSMAGNQPGKGQPQNAKPKNPGDKKKLSPTEKNAWGHLTEADRIEKDNAFQERALPAKESLIDRYFLSVAKKAASRGE